jgi:hypothetical protein
VEQRHWHQTHSARVTISLRMKSLSPLVVDIAHLAC